MYNITIQVILSEFHFLVILMHTDSLIFFLVHHATVAHFKYLFSHAQLTVSPKCLPLLYYISEWQIFCALDHLHPTASGLDELPA